MKTNDNADDTAIQANSFANWSFSGLLIPIAGWILGVKALSKIKYLVPRSKQETILLQNIKSKAWWGIILSTLVFIGAASLTVYGNYLDSQEEQQVQIEARQQQQQADADAQAASSQQLLLNSCLDSIDTWYNENSKGLNTDEYWDRLLEQRKQYTSECYARYPTN